MTQDGLDPVIHAPARLRLMVTLAALPEGDTLSFTRLQDLIGLTPGSAHIISSFLSYAVERKLSKHPEEFGKGAVAGVAGPESPLGHAVDESVHPVEGLLHPPGH